MISYIYKKSFAVLMKRPVRLWGVSLLCIFLTALAAASFSLLPPAGYVVTVALETSMDGEVVSRGRNRREGAKSALAHAELEAIGAACRALGGWRLWQCTLYVTLEPCPMIFIKSSFGVLP